MDKKKKKNRKIIIPLEIQQKHSCIGLKYQKNFWKFAIKHTFYIYNMVPRSENDNLIPNEVFYNEKGNIRTFECVCYYRHQNAHKSKFKPDSMKSNFHGFGKKKYSYIIMNTEK